MKEKSFKSSHAHHVLFFSIAAVVQGVGAANKAGLDALAETSRQLGVH